MKIVPHAIHMFLAIALLLLSASTALAQLDGDEKRESISDEKPGYVKGITSARARSLVGGVVGLASVIIGWRARTRPTGNAKTSRPWSVSALLLGLSAVILSIFHLIRNIGGIGTGGGKAGAIVALVLGIIGVVLGGLALRNRTRVE